MCFGQTHVLRSIRENWKLEMQVDQFWIEKKWTIKDVMSIPRSAVNDMMDQKNLSYEVVREDVRLDSMIPDHSFQFYVAADTKVFMDSCLLERFRLILSFGHLLGWFVVWHFSSQTSVRCLIYTDFMGKCTRMKYNRSPKRNVSWKRRESALGGYGSTGKLISVLNPFPISVILSPRWVRNLLLIMLVFIHFYTRFHVSLTSSLTYRQYVHDVTMIRIQRSASFEFRNITEGLDEMMW